MTIQIIYTFCTDDDFSLLEPEKYGCIGIKEFYNDCDYYDYIGMIIHKDSNSFTCKDKAINSILGLILNGIHVNSKFKWVIEEFTNIMEYLTESIKSYNGGTRIFKKQIYGNYEGTEIMVIIQEE